MAVSQAEKLRIWERGESGLREGCRRGILAWCYKELSMVPKG